MTPDRNDHLERDEILNAVAKGFKPAPEHLEKCPDCNSLYEAFLHFEGVADEVVECPSGRLLEKLSAIPQFVGSRRPRQKVRGNLVFDSWRDIPTAQLRGSATARERRLRFAHELIALDLVAERQDADWEFTARVYVNQSLSCKYVLKVGRARLAPEAHDCYYFKRPTLPKILELLSPDLQIAFDLPSIGSRV